MIKFSKQNPLYLKINLRKKFFYLHFDVCENRVNDFYFNITFFSNTRFN
jgi:hypothetical protein